MIHNFHKAFQVYKLREYQIRMDINKVHISSVKNTVKLLKNLPPWPPYLILGGKTLKNVQIDLHATER